jgi:hypothetical protein
MRKLLVILFALLLISVVGAASASTSGSAVANVFATVNPNITVAIPYCNVDAGTVSMGEFQAQILLRVDANMEQVGFFAEASDLFKGDDPNNTDVAPIPVKSVAFNAEKGNPVAGGTNVAYFYGTGAPIGDFQTKTTDTIWFEGSQSGHFSQDVEVEVSYCQADPEKAQGEYSGKVRLTALLFEASN